MQRKTHQSIAACLVILVFSCGVACAQDTNRVPDINQGVDAADASVHAGVDETAMRAPQPSQEPVKPPTTYSRWGFISSSQPAATLYWPVRAGIATSSEAPTNSASKLPYSKSSFRAGGAPATSTDWSARPGDPTLGSLSEGNSGNSAQQPSLSDNLTVRPMQNGLEGPQRLKTVLPSHPPEPQNEGFSTPFASRPWANAFSSPFSTNQSESIGSSHAFSPRLPQANSASKRDRAEANQHEDQSRKTQGSNHAGGVTRFTSKRESSAHSPLAFKAE